MLAKGYLIRLATLQTIKWAGAARDVTDNRAGPWSPMASTAQEVFVFRKDKEEGGPGGLDGQNSRRHIIRHKSHTELPLWEPKEFFELFKKGRIKPGGVYLFRKKAGTWSRCLFHLACALRALHRFRDKHRRA